MQVLFDLRSPKLVQLQETRVDPLRLVSMLFFGAFVVVSLFNIAYTVINLRDVRAESDSISREQTILVDQAARIDTEIGTLRLYKEKIRAYVAFSKEEMPSVEFLSALEGAVPTSTKLTKLDMKPANVVIRGVALTDQDIVDFGNKLDSMKNIVTKVDAPVTARATSGRRIILEFTMPCTIKDVSAVAASMAEMAPPSGEPSGEEGTPQ